MGGEGVRKVFERREKAGHDAHTGEKIGLVHRVACLPEDGSSKYGNDGNSEEGTMRKEKSEGTEGGERRSDAIVPSELLHDLKPNDEPGSSLEVIRISRTPEHGTVVVEMVVLKGKEEENQSSVRWEERRGSNGPDARSRRLRGSGKMRREVRLCRGGRRR